MDDEYKIYIVQMHTKTLPAQFIKFMTGYQYSHVALAFDEKCDKVYSFGRKNVNSFLHGGFVEEDKQGAFFKKFVGTICRIYELKVTKEQYNTLHNNIMEIKKNSNSYKYDYLGIMIRFFKIPITFKNHYVCSYFVADMLEKANIYKFNKNACFIKPKDFEKIEGAKEIYHGEYNTYKSK